MSEYIFAINDVPINSNQTILAETIIKKLIEKNIWIFKEGAPNVKKIKVGDRILIYECGPGRRFFYGEIEICSEVSPNTQESNSLAENLGLIWMTQYCKIKLIKVFKKPIFIKPLIEKLSFLTEKKNYGLHLRLGIVSIPENDYELIINQDIEHK